VDEIMFYLVEYDDVFRSTNFDAQEGLTLSLEYLEPKQPWLQFCQ